MRTLLLALALAGTALAAPPTLTIPKETKAEPGDFVRLDAVTEGVQVRWFGLDKGLNVFPSELLRDSKSTVVVAIKPGTYRIAAITCRADELSELAVGYVVIGTPEPVPPPPPPVPPTPPTPPPDALEAEVRALYLADADPRKATHAIMLSGFYRQAALAALSADLVKAGDLHAVLARASAGLIPEAALKPIRLRVSAELRKVLPADPEAALTNQSRADASALFSKLAQILGGASRGK